MRLRPLASILALAAVGCSAASDPTAAPVMTQSAHDHYHVHADDASHDHDHNGAKLGHIHHHEH